METPMKKKSNNVTDLLKELNELREENKYLRGELRRLTMGVVHFDFDGESTACNKDLYSVDMYSDNFNEVTCKKCIAAFKAYQRRMDKDFAKKKNIV